jgi:signal recognition particle GTPase
MFGELSAAFSSLKVLTDIAKGMNSLQHGVELNTKAMELTSVVIEIQQRLMTTNVEMEAMHETIRRLNEQILEKESLARYERVVSRTGAILYALKKEFKVSSEPHYYVCQKCLEKDKVAITLQSTHGDDFLRCMICRSVYQATFSENVGSVVSDYDPFRS